MNNSEVLKLQKQVAQGDTNASFALGNLYYSGDCVSSGKPDFIKAAEYYTISAERGDERAMYQLGTMCFFGIAGRKKGERINYKQAAEWFCKSAEIMMKKK